MGGVLIAYIGGVICGHGSLRWGLFKGLNRLHWRGYLRAEGFTEMAATTRLNRLHWRGYLREVKKEKKIREEVLIAYIGGVICGVTHEQFVPFVVS